jgi:nicotinate phosphoribosyltransferase
LIDTYDTIEGARLAVAQGHPFWGVRLDSGDVIELSKKVRKILDDAGYNDAKIMATGDLNEDKLRAICETGAPIDSFGVGTQLATSADAPNLSAVYKMVEIESNGKHRFVAKYSTDKQTIPGAKQIFRYKDRDVVAGVWECPSCQPGSEQAFALLRPVMIEGRLVGKLPSASDARDYCARALEKLSPNHRVEYSEELLRVADELKSVDA